MPLPQPLVDHLPGSIRKRLGYASPPKAITLYLTERCNLHCHMCPHGEGSETAPGPRTQAGAISLDLVDRLLDQMERYRPEIALMGGEPTLHPQCAEAIRRIRQRGFRVNMVTNGTLLEKRAEELIRAGLQTINLSLDGPAEVHDVIRGRAGTFDRAVRGLQACREAESRGVGPSPEFHIFCAITGENHARLVELLEELAPFAPTHVQLNHLRFFTAAETVRHSEAFEERLGQPNDEPEGYQKEIEEVGIDPQVLREQLRTIQDRSWPFQVGVNPAHDENVFDRYYTEPFFERTALLACEAIWTLAMVSPLGEVYPCLHHVCGNLNEQSFMSIWNGPAWRTFRCEISQRGRLPACHRCCY